MTKTKLNFNQITALSVFLIGILIADYYSLSPGLLLMFFGALVFLISSKINIGIIVSYVLIIIGALLKVMHYFGSLFVILIGITGLVGFGLMEYHKKKHPITSLFILISIISILSGIAFKILHILYANLSIFFGTIALLISYSYRFYKKTAKDWEDFLKLMIVYFFCFAYIGGILHWDWNNIPATGFQLSLLLWLILSIKRELKLSK